MYVSKTIKRCKQNENEISAFNNLVEVYWLVTLIIQFTLQKQKISFKRDHKLLNYILRPVF